MASHLLRLRSDGWRQVEPGFLLWQVDDASLLNRGLAIEDSASKVMLSAATGKAAARKVEGGDQSGDGAAAGGVAGGGRDTSTPPRGRAFDLAFRPLRAVSRKVGSIVRLVLHGSR
mgnify:CR=1 FL=1|jgi:hypothetical protein